MKSEAEIVKLRKTLLAAWAPFTKRRSLPVESKGGTVEQAHYMAMGAMAFANAILELPDRPDNLGKLIAGITADNEIGGT